MPIRCAERPDPTSADLVVERFEKRSNRHGEVISMEEKDINIAGIQASQAFFNVQVEIPHGKPALAEIVWMTALVDDDNALSITPLGHPVADQALASSLGIAMRGIDDIPAERPELVEQRKRKILVYLPESTT